MRPSVAARQAAVAAAEAELDRLAIEWLQARLEGRGRHLALGPKVDAAQDELERAECRLRERRGEDVRER